MRWKVALLLLGACLLSPAQTKLSVEQLVSFVRSSVDLKMTDKQVAAYLETVTLTERLDESAMQDLESLRLGARTIVALQALRDHSQTLAAPAKPAPTPPPLPPPPPPPAAEERKVVEQAREYALNYTKSLPNFLCVQVTRRYVDPHGMEFWAPQDTMTARLSYVDHREDYKLVTVNGRMVTNTNIYSVGGAVSSGEFGSMMSEIFEPESEAEFRFERWATLRGRRAYVYSYRISQPRSKWEVTYEGEGSGKESTVPGYHGLIYVDKDLLAVVRITLVAELPAAFPMQQVHDTLDYDLTSISGHEYLLPLRAVVQMRAGRQLSKNEVEFRLYRRFTAEASIHFDAETPDPLPDDKTKEEPAK